MSRTAMPQFPKVYMKASQILDGDTIIDETMKQHLLRYFIWLKNNWLIRDSYLY